MIARSIYSYSFFYFVLDYTLYTNGIFEDLVVQIL